MKNLIHYVAVISIFLFSIVLAQQKITNQEPSKSVDQEKIATKIYGQKCVACHGADMTGGPLAGSLVDGQWKYGGSRDEIIKTITEGRPEDAMPAWGKLLSSEEIHALVKFILDKNQTDN